LGKRLIARTSGPRKSTLRMPPGLSTRADVSPARLGSHNQPKTNTRTATGTVMRNTDPHQARPSNNPPMIGPRAEHPPPIPDHDAMARVRDGPLKRAV